VCAHASHIVSASHCFRTPAQRTLSAVLADLATAFDRLRIESQAGIRFALSAVCKIMMNEPLRQQARALENQFFSQVDQKLLADLRKQLETVTKREVLARVANIKDQDVLDQLLEFGIDAETFTALMFVPLAAVAWADGNVDAQERDAILAVARQANMQPGGLGYELLSSWLTAPPAESLFDAWKSYVSSLKKEMNPEWFDKLKAEVLNDAEEIAVASGGVLGIGRISAAEKKKLAELASAFED
jgi:hypothetical protein